jgi:antitoxin (DNA-binding transcriptional repressor) of toxin-antitoxin stability system
MIDLLIRENDTHVSEIIYRVISGESSTTSPITVPGAIPIASLSLDKPSQRSSSTTSGVPPAAFASFTSPAQTAAARPSSAAAAAAATNVWQQRAAIRKLQQSTDDPQHSQGGQRAASSSLSASTSASVSPVPVHFVGLPSAVTTAPMMATTTLSQHDYVFAHSHVEPMHAEDLKRKAPGFERPSQSLQATPVKPSGGIER